MFKPPPIKYKAFWMVRIVMHFKWPMEWCCQNFKPTCLLAYFLLCHTDANILIKLKADFLNHCYFGDKLK